ncbi:MAG: LemA family protein [Lactobacillaceae bacterium]|jgi:LemA protein|nr:LemA family protein [Lactobacillaceae bacterium]
MNKKVLGAIIAVVAVIVIIFGSFIGTANGLARAEETVSAQQANVATALQRRGDLIPNLVNAVKGSQGQESSIYKTIAEARTQYYNASNKYDNATTTDQKATALNDQAKALNIIVGSIQENYPTLKSADQMDTLMTQLEGTENRIQVERLKYNKDVKTYNTKLVTFPSSLVAGMTGHTRLDYFQNDSSTNSAPVVDFSSSSSSESSSK